MLKITNRWEIIFSDRKREDSFIKERKRSPLWRRVGRSIFIKDRREIMFIEEMRFSLSRGSWRFPLSRRKRDHLYRGEGEVTFIVGEAKVTFTVDSRGGHLYQRDEEVLYQGKSETTFIEERREITFIEKWGRSPLSRRVRGPLYWG